MIGHLGSKGAFRKLATICVAVQAAGVVALVGLVDAEAREHLETPRPAVPVSAAPVVDAELPDPTPAAAPLPADPLPAPPPPPAPPGAPPEPPPEAVAAAPAPVPSATPAPVAPPEPSRQARIEQTYTASVPGAWRSAIAAELSVIPGSTSWAWPDGRIEISEFHADSSTSHLAVVVTHEYGHLVAFRYGTGEYPGAAPAGWPEATSNPAEHWADCVQQVFTGSVSPSHGLPPCAGDQLAWARNFLASGPPA